MREEIIVSGRMNPNIDPVLHIWHWEIPTYLYVGGLAAGLLFFAGWFFLKKKNEDFEVTIKWGPLLVPGLLSIGLLALFLDLRHKMYFWQLYTTLRLESPMSWGAWTLMLVTPLSIIWSSMQLKSVFPNINLKHKLLSPLRLVLKQNLTSGTINWDWRYNWLRFLEKFFLKKINFLAWMMMISAIVLGIYTGILLSAFNARPLWNTSILGPLFLVSGLSTAAAVIMLLSKNQIERSLFSKIDIALIGIELFLIIHMFMGFLASTQVQIEAAEMFLGGPYTLIFWGGVVFLGLLVPMFLEFLELRGYHIPILLPSGLVLIGGLILRFVIVSSGQASRYLY